MPSFATLPRELRDEIYHLVWLATPSIALLSPANSGILVTARYNSTPAPSRSTSALPAWLLTSRQVKVEGTEAFIRHGTTTLKFRGIWPTLTYPLPAPTSLLGLTTTKELVVRLRSGYLRVPGNVYIEDVNYLRDLAGVLAGGPLRRLTVCFQGEHRVYVRDEGGVWAAG